MKLIVGLGNPGQSYTKTRHNVGFMIIDAYAQKYNIEIKKKKFNGLYEEINIKGEKVILLKPQKYMNLSGKVIKDFINFFKISESDVLIIHDDLDLECGHYKIKPKGSSGGHNGLKNIEFHLGTKDYKRIKIGISNNKKIDTKDYVLGKFSKTELDTISTVIDKTLEVLDNYLELSFDKLMNNYNGKV